MIADPERPETLEDVKHIVPELIDLPDKMHKESVGVQVRIRQLLFGNKIHGEDDHKFVFALCRYDTMLPFWPLWDPQGILIKQVLAQVKNDAGKSLNYESLLYNAVGLRSQSDIMNEAKQRGIWNPIRWAVNYSDANWGTDSSKEGNNSSARFQLYLKMAILRKLYKNLKDWDNAKLQNFITEKKSVVTDQKTEDSPFGLLDWAQGK